MKLLIRQRAFSLTDSFYVYAEDGRIRFEVKGAFFSIGHRFTVWDCRTGREVGQIREKLLTLMPEFEVCLEGRSLGTIRKKFTFFRPEYHVQMGDWKVEGDVFGWDYRVTRGGRTVMTISKQLLNWTDTYVLDYSNPDDELPGLMIVLAIDAANCTKKD